MLTSTDLAPAAALPPSTDDANVTPSEEPTEGWDEEVIEDLPEEQQEPIPPS